MNSRFIQTLTIGTLIALTGLGLWKVRSIIVGSPPPHIAEEALAAESRARSLTVREAREKFLDWHKLDGFVKDDIAQIRAHVLEQTTVHTELCTEQMLEALSQQIAEQIAIRSSDDVAEYLSFAEATLSSMRWVTPDDPDEWAKLGPMHEYYNKGSLDDAFTAQAVLAGIVQTELEHQSQLTHYSSGSSGIRVDVFAVFTTEGAQGGVSKLQSADDLHYWVNRPSHNAFRLKVPRTRVGQVLQEAGHAIMAESHTMVFTRSQYAYNLRIYWYWSPSEQAWLIRDLLRTGFVGGSVNAPVAVLF